MVSVWKVPAPPPLPTHETTTTEFPVGPEGEKLVKQFARMRAIKSVGVPKDDVKQDYGLADSQTSIAVVFADGAKTLVVGGRVFGGGDRYLQDLDTNKAFVVLGSMVATLEGGEPSLRPTDLRAFDPKVAAAVEVSAKDKSKRVQKIKVKAPPPDADDPHAPPANADELTLARPLTLGVQQGTLGAGSPSLAGGERFALYRLELQAGRRVRIRMRSAQVDPLLELTGPAGFRVANDDAFPDTLDAMLELVPEVAGTYLLRATTAGANDLGAFTLEVRDEDPAGRGDTLLLDRVQESTLGTPNVLGMPGRWLHFQVEAGTIVTLRVTSTAFDTLAMVIGPDGQRWANDDANDLGPDGTERGLDSTVTFAAAQDGVYQLVVMAYGGQGAGMWS